MDGYVVDLEVHDWGDRGFAIVRASFIHVWLHPEGFSSNNRPWCFDDTTGDPQF